jgi:hypothetical protein
MTSFAATSEAPAVLTVAYDIGEPGGAGWDAAVRHRNMWGKLYTGIHFLDDDTVVLSFRPADNRQRWAEWERVRAAWIMEDLAA